MRSAWVQRERFTRFDGITSKYAVRSVFVVPLRIPPAWVMRRSNSPSSRFSVSSKSMCSKRWAKPERPSSS